jgi:pSer/pThr/pTyr-binding forkhead associated (FHA) protein
MVKCPSCGRENAVNFNFCLDCGCDLKAIRDAFPQGVPAPPPPPRLAKTGPAAFDPPAPAPVAPSGFAVPGPVVRANAEAPAPARPVDGFPPLPPHSGPTADHPQTAALSLSSLPLPQVPSGLPSAVSMPPSPAAPVAMVTCTSCGTPNSAQMKFCGNCGKRLEHALEGGASARTQFFHAAEGGGGLREKMCKLVAIDQSGREGMTFSLKSGETLCGRENGIVLFVDDPFISPTHCKFAFQAGQLRVIDLGSLNGVYIRVRQDHRLAVGDHLRVGRQLFRFESLAQASFQVKKALDDPSRIWGSSVPQAYGRLVQILDDGRTGEIRLLSGERCVVGRETGDIVLPTDGFVSGKHCAFAPQNGEVVLSDLGSSNGTFVRIRNEALVGHGDFLLLGNQMLRIEIA